LLYLRIVKLRDRLVQREGLPEQESVERPRTR